MIIILVLSVALARLHLFYFLETGHADWASLVITFAVIVYLLNRLFNDRV